MSWRMLGTVVALIGGALAAGLLWLTLGGTRPPREGPPGEGETTAPAPRPGVPWFVDVVNGSGVGFVHFDPATPMHYIQETMGSGVAWIDYDGDGWPDLFCVQAGPVRPGDGPRPTSKLYRNNRDGTFTDVTEAAGLTRGGFGMGAAVGDFNNDGFDDLLVTYLGEVVLYANEPDGRGGRRFVDVTRRAGLHNPHWATSAAWGDIDGDGRLDLYVCNYCEVDLANYPECKHGPSGQRMSCPPSHFPSAPHRLYRNNGKGGFEDVTESSGVGAASPSPGLAVAMVDLDGDGKLDIYVANDMRPGFLFHNQGGGKFVEKALLSGCALGPYGDPVAGMGVAVGDVDGSGWPSLVVTNFERKPNVLYLNQGRLLFRDYSLPSGLGGPSVPRLAFGVEFLDADLDGRLDLAVANGHIHRTAHLTGGEYAQQAQLFVGEGKGKFREVSDAAGPYFRSLRVGRGLAVADFNRDGKPDLAVSHVGGPIALLENRTPTDHGWLALDLVGDGVKSNRNAIGARVEVEAGGARQVRFVIGGGSYLSAGERRLLLGLGSAAGAERVTVVWPSGRRQEFRGLAARKAYRLTEGRDAAEPR
ncbi:MAG: CRTAC1 family protein [Gemmataceae bacterium]